ncbi:MAG: hypothetical protein RI993_956 [Pseudomonadota bacterium]|jgi:ABC-type uncharacterized transport system auxiliary subunit
MSLTKRLLEDYEKKEAFITVLKKGSYGAVTSYQLPVQLR